MTYLMHENTVVAEIYTYLGNITNVGEIFHPECLPVGAKNGPLLAMFLNSWQKERAIPVRRESNDLYKTYFQQSTLEAAQASLSLSLTDHYWIKESNDDTKWEEVCFQLNGFSNKFADYFLNNINRNGKFTNTAPDDLKIPDINTDGVLRKLWINTESGPKLFKFGNIGNEYSDYNLLSANEIIGSKVANLMNINAVQYYPSFLPGVGVPVCMCSNFVPVDCEFITAHQIFKEYAGENINLYDILCKMGYKKDLQSMIALIILMHNKDCHNKNYGLIRNAKTKQYIQFAPIFDQGSSLGYDKTNDDAVKPFGNSRKSMLDMIEDLSIFPNQSEVEQIISETYALFGIPNEQLQYTLNDLSNTYEMIKELKKERDYLTLEMENLDD